MAMNVPMGWISNALGQSMTLKTQEMNSNILTTIEIPKFLASCSNSWILPKWLQYGNLSPNSLIRTYGAIL